MENFYREHLTIIDELEVEYNIRCFSGRAVLVTPAPSPEAPLPTPFQFNRSVLRDVVLHNTGVELPLDSVSCYPTGYLLLSHSPEEATRILSAPFIRIGEHVLALAPWTPGFGATEIPCDEHLPQQPLTLARRPRSPQNRIRLHLVISRLPLHLFAVSQLVLPRVFANICQLRDVERDPSDYSLRANTFAELESIPRLVYVGVRKDGQSGPYV